MSTATLQKTQRRENYEQYVRFLLSKVGLSEVDQNEYLNAAQAVYEDKSIIEMIYTGEAERVIREIENDTYVEENPPTED